MKQLMVRKPEMYECMREASFTPGVWMTLVVAFILYAAQFVLRELPANIIDISYYAQQTYTTEAEAVQIVRDYLTSPWTMIAALLLTSVIIVLTLVYVRGIEKRPLSTIGLVRKPLLGSLTAGYAIGLCLLVIAALPELIVRKAEYTGVIPVTAAFFLAFIVQAASEEIYFRGFMLSSLSAKGRFITAVLITSALFAFIHIGNYGATPIHILDIFVSGVLYAFYTLRTGSLWGAIGMHAAWNFALGLFSPFVHGNLVANYSMYKMGPLSDNYNTAVDIYNLGFLGLEIILIALVLFAGRNRLIVQASEERLMYRSAENTARRVLKGLRGEDGRPLLRHALAIADIVEEEQAKAAWLLYEACRGGNIGEGELDGLGFSNNVLNAVKALLYSPKGIVSPQVKADPIALAVTLAAVTYDDEHAGDRRAKRKSSNDSMQCPLLRREIEKEYCGSVIQSVDEGADGVALNMFDTGICKGCPNRNGR